MGRRAAGQDHDQVLALLREARRDVAELETDLARLLALKTKAEYDPKRIPEVSPTAGPGRRTCLTVRGRRQAARLKKVSGRPRSRRVPGVADRGQPTGSPLHSVVTVNYKTSGPIHRSLTWPGTFSPSGSTG